MEKDEECVALIEDLNEDGCMPEAQFNQSSFNEVVIPPPEEMEPCDWVIMIYKSLTCEQREKYISIFGNSQWATEVFSVNSVSEALSNTQMDLQDDIGDKIGAIFVISAHQYQGKKLSKKDRRRARKRDIDDYYDALQDDPEYQSVVRHRRR